jgi:SAM-dependent methyltransferase
VTRYVGGPFGRALRAYQRGEPDARELELRSDLGEREEIPVAVFFREPKEFFSFEREALRRCRGRVLDLGAGAGVHALPLQERGFEVVAVEVDPEVCRVLRRRGVRHVVRADAFSFQGGPFDTVLMLMNGAGLAGTLDGLRVLLGHLSGLVAPGGQLLLDSADLRPGVDRQRPFASREDGRYIGEVQIQLAFRGEWGDPFPELYVDPDTLAVVAERAGWRTEILLEEEDGSFLARLTPAA